MTQRDTDAVSTLVDGELDERELKIVIHELDHDAAMRSCWRNYHLIGDAIRGNLPKYMDPGLSDRITEALRHEPVFMKPQTHPPAVAPTATLSRTKAATAGFALAASLSAIAIVGIMGIEHKAAPSGGAMMTTASVEHRIGDADGSPHTLASLFDEMIAVTGSGGDFSGAIPSRSVAVSGNLPVSTDLYEYLMNYHTYAQPAGNEDVLSYLRAVSHGPGQ